MDNQVDVQLDVELYTHPQNRMSKSKSKSKSRCVQTCLEASSCVQTRPDAFRLIQTRLDMPRCLQMRQGSYRAEKNVKLGRSKFYFQGKFSSAKGRTELKTCVSRAKQLKELDFGVQKCLAPRKISQTCEKIDFRVQTKSEKNVWVSENEMLVIV